MSNIHNPSAVKQLLKIEKLAVQIRALTGRSGQQARKQITRYLYISRRSVFSVFDIHQEWCERYCSGWKLHHHRRTALVIDGRFEIKLEGGELARAFKRLDDALRYSPPPKHVKFQDHPRSMRKQKR